MRRRLEMFEIRRELKNNGNVLNEEEFLERVKINVSDLYNCAKSKFIGNYKGKLSEKILKKMIENSDKFRLYPEIDRISVQYAGFYDYFVEEKEGCDEKNQFLKINTTINFHDDVNDNNERFSLNEARCWNDIWIITYKKIKDTDKMFNCSNCGAVMAFLKKGNLLKCEYCGNMKLISNEWEIVDVEVKDGFLN